MSWRRWLIVAAGVAIVAAAGYFLWLRHSSLVAVNDVEVVGVLGPERDQIIAELTTAAEEMTTLTVDRERLEAIGERFATVESLSVDPNIPHGLRIEIVERRPALIGVADGEAVSIAGDGTVLAGVDPPEGIPSLQLDEVPRGSLGGRVLELALVAGAAPDPLRPLIEGLTYDEAYGVELSLEGIPVRFGTADRAKDKWATAAAVLADPKLEAVAYVDVRVPERPAAGGAAAAYAP